MIPTVIDSAIVEIVAPDGTSLGTGFVVSDDGAVLTAAHVVVGRGAVIVRLADGSELPSARVTPDAGGQDWAIVEIGGGRAAPPRAVLEGVGAAVSWTTVGHAAVRGRAGLHGVVRAVAGRELELYCAELDGKTWGDARGVSGAPCVIDGAAVALITGVVHRPADQVIINGEVRALLLSEIVAATARFTIDGTTRLPWEDVVTAALEPLLPAAQLTAAEHARLANPILGTRLPGQIARRMINQGFETIVKVVRQVRGFLASSKACEQILYAAGTLWIDPRAAHQLAAAIVAPRAVQLQTTSDRSAEQHLGRAFTHVQRGPVPWRSVVVAYEERFAEVVVERVRDALDARLLPVDDAHLDELLAEEPVVAFLLATPDARCVDLLAARWAALRVVFLSRAVPTSATRIAAIEPAPASELEVRAWSKYERALQAANR